MPYYAGDMYVGDPGLFSFIKKAAHAVSGVVSSPLGSIVTGLIPGGGLLKTGLGILGSVGGAIGGGGRAAAVAGGTPGAVAAGGRMLAHARVRFRRSRRPRRR